MRPTTGSLLQTVAVSVATVLGTGILGLPVTLHASGMRPFLLTFTLNVLAQIGIVFAMVELLQRVYVRAVAPTKLPQYQLLSDDEHSPISAPPAEAPSLHALGAQFISSAPMRFIFNAAVTFHFIFILSTYSLAAPQAYIAIFPALSKIPFSIPITIFVVVTAILVVCFSALLVPSVSFGTLLKAVLLTVLILITLARGLVINRTSVDDWKVSSIVDPFLMGFLALSGVVNLMPITFQACLNSLPANTSIDTQFVRAYRGATVVAIIMCYFLCVTWVYAVLLVVPQSAPTVSSESATLSASTTNATLTAASESGLISTVPLMEVLKARNDPTDTVVSVLVNIFTALSVTISFLILSLGTKHYIDGMVKADYPVDSSQGTRSRYFRYVLFFSIVLAIALSNQSGLFKIMEGFTTLSLTLEAGLFIIYMFYISRADNVDGDNIPLPLSSYATYFILGFSGLYFLLAVLVDSALYVPSTF